MITDAILEQLIQAISETVWKRPELARLREPIEQTLQARSFKQLTRQALSNLDAHDELPELLTDAFISHDVTQRYLSAYIVRQDADAIPQLAAVYARQFGGDASTISGHLEPYLKQLRETLATDDTYGPILIARDVQVVVAGINNLQSDMGDVKQLLRDLMAEPELQALVERKQGRHIFLSYTRANLTLATKIRHALEDAGHTVWQDVTAIKGGIEWIQSIEDGIDRSYAVVSVVSHQSQESEWVTIEFLHATRREKQIVPIKIDNCDIPTMMLTRNVVHGHPDMEQGIQTLLGALPPVAGSTVSSGADTFSEPAEPVDRRQLEIDYLDRILLEHSVWQTVYTPMAGVGQMRVETEDHEEWEVASSVMGQVFNAFWEEAADDAHQHHETRQESYQNILDAVQQMQQLVLLGEPGSGKSTSLWRIAADAAEKAKTNPDAPLPVIIRLGELTPEQTVSDKVQATLGELSSHYHDLLTEKRLLFLLDGLNEMPAENRKHHAKQVKNLVETCQQEDLIVIVSCRRLDYVGDLDMSISEQVEVAPLDPLRIRQFVNAYITKPAGKGDELFWELAGQTAQDFWQDFTDKSVVDEHPENTFWLNNDLPDGKVWGERWSTYNWEEWLREREHPRSMMSLARNPFMLFMVTQVFTRAKRLPENRGTLFERFVDFLLEKRENLSKQDAIELKNNLADLGFKMQREGEGTAFNLEQVRNHLSEQQLYQAKSANLLTGSDQIRFTHQLLQEYHAAKRLDREIQAGRPATDFFPQDNWWQPTGWEETAILLAGLYSKNTTPVLAWLRDAQPELTARCVVESGAHTPDETIQCLQPHWQPRIIDLDEPALARASVGRALGLLNIDQRVGIGVDDDGLPDVVWCDVPAGNFLYGDDKETQTIETPFAISKYLITNAQFAPFIRDGGYSQQRFWTEAGWIQKENEGWAQPRYWHNTQWNLPDHPVVGVSWYEAYAYAQWVSEKLGYSVQLPTEHQWEKAARSTDGRTYPWGDEWDANKCNNSVDTPSINQTCAVGIFPDGVSAYHAHDMVGNVLEWCLAEHKSGSNNAEGTNARVWRGGSWSIPYTQFFRVAYRDWDYPDGRGKGTGFRIARSYTRSES